MRFDPIIHQVFGHFQNLNLLVLIDDLQRGRTAQGEWSSGMNLCPVAHGLQAGHVVQDLHGMSQTTGVSKTAELAARALGAPPAYVAQFIRHWDAHAFSDSWLCHRLDALWQERLADAEVVEEILREEAGKLPPSSLAATSRVG